jgi:YtkA-like
MTPLARPQTPWLVLLLLVAAGCGGAAHAAARHDARGAATRITAGPAPVRAAARTGPYTVHVRIAPNRAAVRNAVVVKLRRSGARVSGAAVTATLGMLTMDMGTRVVQLRETRPGSYRATFPRLGMAGLWGFAITAAVPGGHRAAVVVVDHMR